MPTLRITEEHIKQSMTLLSDPEATLCHCCPTALALNEQFGNRWAVGSFTARNISTGRRIMLGKELQEQVYLFYRRSFQPGEYEFEYDQDFIELKIQH